MIVLPNGHHVNEWNTLRVNFWVLARNLQYLFQGVMSIKWFVVGLNILETLCIFSSVKFSRSVVSDSLWPYGQQHASLPCPSLSPRFNPNSCPLSRWCHPTISSSVVPFSSCPQSFPASGSLNESVLHIRWLKYWSLSFSISPSCEYSGLISCGMDWLDLLPVQETLKSVLQYRNSKAWCASWCACAIKWSEIWKRSFS